MSSPDDIAPLLEPQRRAGSAVEMRQATITAWDSATAANTVSFDGGVLSNLGVLSTSSGTVLAADDVVLLVRFESTWFILGRIVVPTA